MTTDHAPRVPRDGAGRRLYARVVLRYGRTVWTWCPETAETVAARAQTGARAVASATSRTRSGDDEDEDEDERW